MAIRVRCKNCGSKVKLSSRYLGQKVDCPNCQVKIKVPGEETIEAQRQRRATRENGPTRDAPIKARISEPLKFDYYALRLFETALLLFFVGGLAYLLLSYGFEVGQRLARPGNEFTLERGYHLIGSIAGGILVLGGLIAYCGTFTTSLVFSESLEIRSIFRTRTWDWNDIAHICFYSIENGAETTNPDEISGGLRIGRKDGSLYKARMFETSRRRLYQFLVNSGLRRLIKTRPAPEYVRILNVFAFISSILLFFVPIIVVSAAFILSPVPDQLKSLIFIVAGLGILSCLVYIIKQVPYRVTLDKEVKANYFFQSPAIQSWSDITDLTYFTVRFKRSKIPFLALTFKDGSQISWIGLLDPRLLPDIQAIAMEKNPKVTLQL